MTIGSTKILFLSVLCSLFLLNFPWLSMFSHRALVFGIPLFYVYLFGLWFVIILVIYLLTEQGSENDINPEQAAHPQTKAETDAE